jgi:hypothetical protein
MLLDRIAHSICAKTDTIRLFRSPSVSGGMKDVIKSINDDEFDGRYFTLDPKDAVGYHSTYLVEVSEVSVENMYLSAILINMDRNESFEKQEVDDGVIQARRFGVPSSVINKIVFFIENYFDLVNDNNTINTIDGVLTYDMVDVLQEAFSYVDRQLYSKECGQVDLTKRNVRRDEIIAVYEVNQSNKIVDVIELSGQPTFNIGDMV